MAHDIFISYAREDLERVKPIVRILLRRGWTVWWDQRLLAGKRFTDSIQSALQGAKAVIVLWSESSVGSLWVQSEAEEGMVREVLVPIRIADVTPPHPFGRLQGVDHFVDGEPTGKALALLVRSLEHMIGKPAARPVAAPARPATPPARPPTAPARQPAPAPPAPSVPPPPPMVVAAPPVPESSPRPQNVGEQTPAPPPLSLPRRRPVPARAARAKRPWLSFGLPGVGLAAALLFGWKVRTSWGREDSPADPEIVSEGPAAEPIRPGSSMPGSPLPGWWTVVDETSNAAGLPRRVREPGSGIEFLLVEPGEFWMGSPETEPDRQDDETRHRVRITRPFYMGVTEVTVSQVARLAGKTERSDLPMNNISFADARAVCREIGCDLPTEAQWELAARAGTESRWWWGETPKEGEGKANLYDFGAALQFGTQMEFRFDDGYPGLAPVGQFEANPFGFFDMIGNVWEWCLDDYSRDYGPLPVSDPRYEYDGRLHVARGGSFSTPVHQTRAAHRLTSNGSVIQQAGVSSGQTGFRMVFNLP